MPVPPLVARSASFELPYLSGVNTRTCPGCKVSISEAMKRERDRVSGGDDSAASGAAVAKIARVDDGVEVRVAPVESHVRVAAVAADVAGPLLSTPAAAVAGTGLRASVLRTPAAPRVRPRESPPASDDDDFYDADCDVAQLEGIAVSVLVNAFALCFPWSRTQALSRAERKRTRARLFNFCSDDDIDMVPDIGDLDDGAAVDRVERSALGIDNGGMSASCVLLRAELRVSCDLRCSFPHLCALVKQLFAYYVRCALCSFARCAQLQVV